MVPNDAAGTSFTTLSRATYGYDQTAPTATSSNPVSNHDTAAFGTGFTTRGNLTSATTWDTVNTGNSITTTTKYNTTGSPIEPRSISSTASTASFPSQGLIAPCAVLP